MSEELCPKHNEVELYRSPDGAKFCKRCLDEVYEEFVKGRMRSKAVFPTRFEAKAREVDDKTWELEYREWHRPEHKTAFERSLNALKRLETLSPLAGMKIETESGDDWVGIRMRGPVTEVYNFLAGEFLFGSSIGRASIADLLAGWMLRALEEEVPHTIKGE